MCPSRNLHLVSGASRMVDTCGWTDVRRELFVLPNVPRARPSNAARGRAQRSVFDVR
jgi:hypothetical protein